jgi:hypothetical protein
MSFVSMMEKLQIKDENISSAYNNGYGLYTSQSGISSHIQQEQQHQQNTMNNRNSHHNSEKSNNKNENGKNNSDRNDKLSPSSLTSPKRLSPLISNTPRLGVGAIDLTPSLAEDMRLPMKSKGAVVQSVFHGSPAYRAGLKGSILDVDKSGYLIRRGDVIIAVDGHKINGAIDIIKQLKKKHPGDLLNLVVNRNNQILNMNTKL